MRIQNNMSAVNTHRYYNIANQSVASSAEKLSSGYRINRAGDDAAGLAISEKMRAQIRGLSMASKNSSDAISLIQTAEGALQSTHNILQRMRELAVQSGSDTNEQVIDRGALQKEFAALAEEINDTASKTRFNDQNLIDGTFQKTKKFMDGGTTTSGGFNAIVDRAKAGSYAFTAVATARVAATSTAGTANVAISGADVAMGIATAADNAVTAIAGTAGNNDLGGTTIAWVGATTDDHNGMTYTLDFSGTADNMTVALMDSSGKTVATVQNIDFTKAAGATKAVDLDFKGVGKLTYTLAADTVLTDSDASTNAVKAALNNKKIALDAAGVDPTSTPAVEGYVTFSLGGYTEVAKLGDTNVTFEDLGIQLQFAAITDATIKNPATVGNDGPAFTNGNLVIKENTGASMIIQTGANEGDQLEINIDAMNTAMLGISGSAIDTQAHASKAITEVNNAINIVSTQRAALGALQNRLDFKIANLDTSAENLQGAESRIRDVDMAKEMTAFSKKNILVQAATAMLAQANSAPQNVLQLLR